MHSYFQELQNCVANVLLRIFTPIVMEILACSFPFRTDFVRCVVGIMSSVCLDFVHILTSVALLGAFPPSRGSAPTPRRQGHFSTGRSGAPPEGVMAPVSPQWVLTDGPELLAAVLQAETPREAWEPPTPGNSYWPVQTRIKSQNR